MFFYIIIQTYVWLRLFVIFLLHIRRLFFFFNQKMSYEMHISDWSSDVCSSDLFVDQIGDGNTASISQSVGNNPNPTGGTDPVVATAEITQSGNGNYSTVNQFGGSATQSARLMVAESVQSGNNNLSTI